MGKSGDSLSSPGPAPQAPSPTRSDPGPTPVAPYLISSLVPHQGGMCLLERVVSYDDQRIHLETTTHRAADNPLRIGGRLRAIHLCEYGAQAMAVHGALKARDASATAAPGVLVALRSVTFTCDYIEDLRGVLSVSATCLQASASSQQYEFTVAHDGVTIAQGRAAVVLGMPKPEA